MATDNQTQTVANTDGSEDDIREIHKTWRIWYPTLNRIQISKHPTLAVSNDVSERRLPSAHLTHHKGSKQFTAQEYALAIETHANRTINDSLYPGHHFRSLASFLWRPYEEKAPRFSSSSKIRPLSTNDQAFIHLTDFRGEQQSQPIRTFGELEAAISDLPPDTTQGQVLFMRGYQSPDWLNAIGSRCRLDPEFLLRHLSFSHDGSDAIQGRVELFSLPSLPSAYSNVIRLRMPTIGSRSLSRLYSHQQEQASIADLRQEVSNLMLKFTGCVMRHDEDEIMVGDSIVREYSIHDLEHFSFEQDITLTVSHFDGRWIVVCWLDIGNPLEEGQNRPWASQLFLRDSITATFFPTIQHKPLVALKDHIHNHDAAGKKGDDPKRQGYSQFSRRQTASVLHIDHGFQVDPEIALFDPFYAVSSIFRFVAFAESQFLNMVELKLRRELDREVLINNRQPTLANLIYSKQVLERHVQHIQEPIAFIEGMSETVWPRIPRRGKNANPQHREKADASLEQILRDYQHLLNRARYLSSECDRGTNIVMNEVMVRESQKAIEQAERVTKLTTLAFLFIPLSFTSSFFGMNFAQFNNGSYLNFWVWIAVSVPVLVISLVFLIWDVSELKQILLNLKTRRGDRQGSKQMYD